MTPNTILDLSDPATCAALPKATTNELIAILREEVEGLAAWTGTRPCDKGLSAKGQEDIKRSLLIEAIDALNCDRAALLRAANESA